MTETVAAHRLLHSFETVLSYLVELLEADFDRFPTKQRLFVNAGEMDDIFRHFVWEWHGTERDAMEWYHARATGEGAPIPEAEWQRMALAYALLFLASRRRIEPRSLVVNCFEGTAIPVKLKRFKEDLLVHLRDGMKVRFAWMVERFTDPGEMVDLETFPYSLLYEFDELRGQAPEKTAPPPEAEVFSESPGSGPVIQKKTRPLVSVPPGELEAAAASVSRPAPSRPVPPPTEDPVSPALPETGPDPADFLGQLGTLKAGVEEAKRLQPAQQEDLLVDVQMLELELGRHRPDPLRAKDLLGQLERCGVVSVARAATRLRETLGRHL